MPNCIFVLLYILGIFIYLFIFATTSCSLVALENNNLKIWIGSTFVLLQVSILFGLLYYFGLMKLFILPLLPIICY